MVCLPDPPPIHKLREAQLADSTLGRILCGKEAGEKPAAEEIGRASRSSCRLLQLWDQLLVHNGILCRRFEPPDRKEPIIQFVIPEELRAEVLADLHEGAMGGHLGVDKTLSRLKERFYWPGHYNDVQDWCGSCLACASRKNPSPKARAPLTSIKTGYPFTDRGNGYCWSFSRVTGRQHPYPCGCGLLHQVDGSLPSP